MWSPFPLPYPTNQTLVFDWSTNESTSYSTHKHTPLCRLANFNRDAILQNRLPLGAGLVQRQRRGEPPYNLRNYQSTVLGTVTLRNVQGNPLVSTSCERCNSCAHAQIETCFCFFNQDTLAK